MMMQQQAPVPQSKKKICLVGGHGAMGQCLMRFFQTCHYRITVFDEHDWKTAPETKLQNQDLVLLCVPIADSDAVIRKVAAYLDKETILADITSIKAKPIKAMLNAHQGPVLGLHPIFGPSILTAAQQCIIYCDGRFPKQYQWFLDDLTKLGFHIKRMSTKAHDEAMTFIQGIEHFVSFCIGDFLKSQNADLEALYQIASPVYQMELNIIGRLFYQDPKLYGEIIAADKARLKAIDVFSKRLGKQAQALQKPGGKAKFIEQFKAIQKWMGSFSEKAYRQSDRILHHMRK